MHSKVCFPTIANVRQMSDAARMNEDNITWLSQWYLSQCDNDWEHSHGVEIGTLDNPGWEVKVALTDTTLEGRSFDKVEHGTIAQGLGAWKRTGSWWTAEVKDNAFQASCGPLDLSAVIGLFRRWAQSAPRS